jgi:RNA polymerase sigma-70 factor, ECF subfamily
MDTGKDRERELIRRLKAGDDDGFEMMVRVHGGRMLAVAKRFLPVEQDARDALQVAFLSAFRSIGKFAGEARLSTWLHRIVVNTALMQIRSRKRRNEDSIEELLPRFNVQGAWIERHGTYSNSGEQLLEQREIRELVRRCIARLPDNYRHVLLMRDIEELEYKEIAMMLNANINAVKVRLHRARQALRSLIMKELRDSGELSFKGATIEGEWIR